jgi:ankyrin repeat protein
MRMRKILLLFTMMASCPAIAGVAASMWQLQNPTPLMIAAENGEIATVRNLLASGSNVNEKNYGGSTPLIYAASRGQLEVVRLLLSKGAGPNLCADENMCPLWYAARHGSYDTVKTLLDAGANAKVNPSINALEHPALHLAAARGHVNIVTLLINHGAEIDFYKYFSGNTALAMAVRVGKVKTSKILIERGANLGWVTEVPYYKGESALEIAKKEGYSEVVTLVLNALKSKKYNQPKYSVDKIIDRLYKDPSFSLKEEGSDLLEYLRRQTKESLRQIRNVIFARKNYRFEDQKLIKYFSERFSSYKPFTRTITMSVTDKRNVEYMKAVEEYAVWRDAAG